MFLSPLVKISSKIVLWAVGVPKSRPWPKEKCHQAFSTIKSKDWVQQPISSPGSRVPLTSDISTNVSVGKTWPPISLKSSEVHTSTLFGVWQRIWSLCCREIFSFLWSKVVVAECFPTGESSNHCAQQQCSSEGGHCWPRYLGRRFLYPDYFLV